MKMKYLLGSFFLLTILFPFNTYASTLLDSFDVANADTSQGIGTDNYNWYGQCFTTPNDGNSYQLISAKMALRKDLSPTDTITYRLYASTGTCGTSATPTGALLDESDGFSASTITGSFAFYSDTFSSPYTLSPNTDYFIMAKYAGTYGATAVYIGVDQSSPADNGNRAFTTNNGSTYTGNNTGDVPFEVYGDIAGGGGGSTASSTPFSQDTYWNLLLLSEFLGIFLFSFYMVYRLIR